MARDRKKHACESEALTTAPPHAAVSPSVPIATSLPEPHPSLIEIVRLLAWQAAKTDLAAQRSTDPED